MFKLINTNRFYLPGTNNQFLHLATVQNGVQEYICIGEVKTAKIYIEDITGGGGPFYIKDDCLVEALTQFLTERDVLNMSRPLIPDSVWYQKE